MFTSHDVPLYMYYIYNRLGGWDDQQGELFNHGDFDWNPDAKELVHDMVRQKGWLASFNSHQQCERFVGGPFVLSKFAMLVKEKWSDTSQSWVKKNRFIMDGKSTGVTSCSHKSYKTVLPRVSEAAFNLLELSHKARRHRQHFQVIQLVLDATDAFWNVPLSPIERRWFVSKVQDKYLVYLKTAQGSRGAPLSWAVLFGLACRLGLSSQVLLIQDAFVLDTLLEAYVDDPHVSLAGTIQEIEINLVVLVLDSPRNPVEI